MTKCLKYIILTFSIFFLSAAPALSEKSNQIENSQIITHFKKFYFIRHGKTDFNKNHQISGSTDIPLNKEGIKQADRAARILKNYKIDIIIASPMLRTRQTAEIISKAINIPIIYNKDLREINWGELEGQDSNSPYVKKQINFWLKNMDIKGGENKRNFQTRIALAIDGILAKYDNPLIVSHGGVFGNLCEIMGDGYIKTENATPYEFLPINNPAEKTKFKILPLK